MIYIGRVITQSIIYIITIIMVPEEQEKKTLIIIKLIKKLELLKCDINSRFRTVQCFINNLITMRKCRIPAIKKKKKSTFTFRIILYTHNETSTATTTTTNNNTTNNAYR